MKIHTANIRDTHPQLVAEEISAVARFLRLRKLESPPGPGMERAHLVVFPAFAGVMLLTAFVPLAARQSHNAQHLGSVHFETSCNEAAQFHFDRGMRYQLVLVSGIEGELRGSSPR